MAKNVAKKEKNAPPAEEPQAPPAAPAESAPAKGGGQMKLIIIVAAALAVGLGGGMAAMKFMGGSTPAEDETYESAPPQPLTGADSETPIDAPKRSGAEGLAAASGSDGEPGGEMPAGDDGGPVNIEFKPFIVNLNDVGGKRFLKLTMSIEADSQALAAELNAKMPQFRDVILLLLSSLSYDDIATVDGKMRLRNQMLNRINTQLSSGKVRNIYFSEFVVQ